MGKWAQYQKRGTAQHLGPYGTPPASALTATGITSSAITTVDGSTRPQLATGYWAYYSLTPGGPIATVMNFNTGTTLNWSGLNSGTDYYFRYAWGTSAARLSPFSDYVKFTTL